MDPDWCLPIGKIGDGGSMWILLLCSILSHPSQQDHGRTVLRYYDISLQKWQKWQIKPWQKDGLVVWIFIPIQVQCRSMCWTHLHPQNSSTNRQIWPNTFKQSPEKIVETTHLNKNRALDLFFSSPGFKKNGSPKLGCPFGWPILCASGTEFRSSPSSASFSSSRMASASWNKGA